ncbi:MAG: anti-sigma factor [Acidobacteriota bacterium]|nr:anti-sigma factor [Acidobacteriota bacterium]
MDDELMHELVAGYALDALEPEQEQAFEVHLARCPECREQLALFTATAGALAHAAPAASPPPALRARILESARAERANVVPLRPRWAHPAAALAAVASCAAIALGLWIGLGSSAPAQLTALALHGASGSVVRASNGKATLVLSGLQPAPNGKTYEAWVMLPGRVLPAGLFDARGQTTTLTLSRDLPKGAIVGVTLEHAGGSSKPTGTPLVTSARA